MSYRKHHIRNKIGKIRPKKSIFKKIWFWILLLFIVLFFSVFYFVLFYPGIQVKDITISGNIKIDKQELKDFVLTKANTGLINFLNIKISSRSILLVDKNKVNKDILEKFPIIEKINIDKKIPRTIILGITERKPLGVFCDENTNECFLIDQNGIIYEKSEPNKTGAIIVRQNWINGQMELSNEVVSKNVANSIYKIQKSLKDNFQINVSEALVTSPIRLDIKTSENWKIYFGLDQNSDINTQILKLNLLLQQEITRNIREELQYIDLRFKDRAYYK